MARVRYIDKFFLVHSLTPDYIYMLIQAKTYIWDSIVFTQTMLVMTSPFTEREKACLVVLFKVVNGS